jgi:uncharacterized membrane protein
MSLSFRIIVFAFILIWCIGIFSEWLLPIYNNVLFLIPFLEKTYSLVCHQIKERLINFNNCETLVCARCTGIYLGALFSSALSLSRILIKPLDVKYFFLMSLPLLMDVILHSFNVYNYSRTIAFCTGFLFGSTGFLYLYDALNQLINELKSGKA